MTYPCIVLKKGREKSVLRLHPWVFSGAVQESKNDPREGDVVDVVDAGGKFLARGIYASGSLMVKILTHEEENIDGDWFLQRLQKAQDMRAQIGLPTDNTNAYRLMHGEGDGVPGLIIDVYNHTAVIQPHAKGIADRLNLITKALKMLGFNHVLHKPVGRERAEVLYGNISERIEILEHGVRFRVDVLHGQKTGFFLDQRDSRELLAKYAKDKSVLNVFSYTGGFSMAAATAGAKSVLSVDASASALDIAQENAQINGVSDIHRIFKVDAVPYLESLDEDFDIIVLDPPAFAKHKSARHSAIQAYRRINQAALKHLKPGGILFTFSCSQVVDRPMFDNMLLSAAINEGRQVQILHKLRQPADHPVSLAHPEGEYLKGLVLRVND